jgi:hypothetical protein
MKLPNWFRIVWWALSILLITGMLIALDDLFTGHAVAFDVVMFLVLVAVCLMPLFQELNLRTQINSPRPSSLGEPARKTTMSSTDECGLWLYDRAAGSERTSLFCGPHEHKGW